MKYGSQALQSFFSTVQTSNGESLAQLKYGDDLDFHFRKATWVSRGEWV